jgi:hypothetical protein
MVFNLKISGLAAAAAAVPLAVVSAGTAGAASAHRDGTGSYTVTQLVSGKGLTHRFTPAGSTQSKTEPLTQPDDITALGDNLFAGFQNGVGSQGQASKSGNSDSTVVEFTPHGRVLHQWDVRGKVDGLGSDPLTGQAIATVDEDGNSSLYTIAPYRWWGGQVQHYTYSKLPHNGGTDAVSFYHGEILISASAPGTTGGPAAPNAAYPAAYSVTLNPFTHVATTHGVFSDEATATAINGSKAGQKVKLALTDPDSNTVVPGWVPKVGGAFQMVSQAEQQEIFVRDAGTRHQSVSVLNLPQVVDDTAWATSSHGRLFVTDNSADTVSVVTGLFRPGTAFVAVTPGSGASYLGTLNTSTGQISKVTLQGPALQAKGLKFIG